MSCSGSEESLRIRLPTTPEVIEPLTLTKVRIISINGSIDINKPASSNGIPKVDNTMMAANVAPPPTPATPNEAIMDMPITEAINPIDQGSSPIVGAIIIANMAGYTPAQPFWPMVAPNDAEKFAIGLAIPSLLICTSIFKGIVAAELRDS